MREASLHNKASDKAVSAMRAQAKLAAPAPEVGSGCARARASLSAEGGASADQALLSPLPSKGVAPAPVEVLRAENLGLSWDVAEAKRRCASSSSKASADGAHFVVRDINITLHSGEIVCLLGRSGTGKTTILHALSGLIQPQEGTIFLHTCASSDLLGHVSYMFQKDLLLKHKTILDNVCLPLTIAGRLDDHARAQASDLFSDFGLEGAQGKYPHELSGGMRQRAAFLRTYLMGNDCILLDEAFSALDAITRTHLRLWFCSMVQQLNLAVLAVTHDVDEAVLMASRIYVLKQAPHASFATIAAEIKSPRLEMSCGPEEFMLSPQFLACKKEVLAAL